MNGVRSRAWGVGFVGAGWLGESLIKEIESCPQLRLVAVQDLDPIIAGTVATRYGAAWHGDRFDELIKQADVDLVVISTPNADHAPQALAALAAGKHLLVQKPLATSLADVRTVIAAARAASRLLVVDYSYRYLETARALLAELPSLGQIRHAEAAFHNIYGPGKAWFFDKERSGGGALVDLGVHLIDLLLTAVGPQHISLDRAELKFPSGASVEDRASLTLALDGLPASLDVSWNDARPLTEISLTFTGEHGTATWRNVDGSFFRFQTVLNGRVVLDRETTLRRETLETLVTALETGLAPGIDERVYDIIDRAYGDQS